MGCHDLAVFVRYLSQNVASILPQHFPCLVLFLSMSVCLSVEPSIMLLLFEEVVEATGP